jgi:hypothetical protein
MRTTLVVCLSVVGFADVCLAPVAAWAQTAGAWEVQWEQLRMDVKGANTHIGDVTTISGRQTLTPPLIDERVTHTPIDLNLEGRNTFRAAVAYRGQRWGAGMGGWFLRTADDVAGHVSSPPDVLTPASRSYEFNTVLMWEELLSPIRNDLEPSRVSPVDFHASGRLRTYVVDAFALAALTSSDAARLELIAGGKLARIRAEEDQDLKVRAFVLNAFRPLHFHNNIALSSGANARVNGAGPMIGVAGRLTWRRLRLDSAIRESMVYGSADQSGTFSDIDDVQAAVGPDGPFVACPRDLAVQGCTSIRSDWTFARSEKAFIWVTDLEARVLVDITSWIAVGATSFTSNWSNVPAPPAFSLSHSDAGPGLDWQFQENDVRFGAAGLVVAVRF